MTIRAVQHHHWARWLILIILGLAVSPLFFGLSDRERFRYEANRIDELLLAVGNTVPGTCSERAWRNAVDRLRAGVWNGCYSVDWVTASAMASLHKDLKTMKEEMPPSADLLRYMWVRVGESSTKAGRLISRHRLDFEEHVAPCDVKPAAENK